MTKTVLITGATGLLGRQVVKAFSRTGWTVVGTGFTRANPPSIIKVDLTSSSDPILQVLEDVKPNVVVHCAANRFPDKCSSDPKTTVRLNTTATGALALYCSTHSILLIYISTDYVFPGTLGHAPYAVTAEPQPSNLYGQSKLDGEKEVISDFRKVGKRGWGVVLRVPVLYGTVDEGVGGNKESAVNVLMDTVWDCQEEGRAVEMDHWAIRYPTNTEDVARVVQDVATKYLETEDKSSLPEILHFSSEDKMTKYEICQLFGEIMGLPTENIKPKKEGNDPNSAVQRPYDCHLDSRALGDLGIDTNTMDFTAWWRREVRAFRK